MSQNVTEREIISKHGIAASDPDTGIYANVKHFKHAQ